MRRTSALVTALLLPLATACGTAGDPADESAATTKDLPVSSETDEMLGLRGALGTLTEGLEAARKRTGSYPSDASGIDLWPSRARVVYARTGRGFRACVQAGSDGPWFSATEAAEHRSLGDGGRCSYDAPPAGSVREVRRDLLQLLDVVGARTCEEQPRDATLRSRGVLGEGNRIGLCREISWQDGDVSTWAWCVQHGDDGAWAAADGAGDTWWAEGGTCDPGPAER